jgi:tetratricopeptide (TPR) repeat protein
VTTSGKRNTAANAADEVVYTLRAIQEMLGLSRHAVLELVEAGFVKPGRGPRNAYRFRFQDVVLLRTAQALRDASIPTRRIVRALRSLRESLPDSVPLSGLRITAVGDDVAIRDSGQDFALESGQWLFDFDVARKGEVLAFPARSTPPATGSHRLVETAQSLEKRDPAAAVASYHEAITNFPDDPDAYLGFGALLYEWRRYDEALTVYDAALVVLPDAAELHYNRAIVLEDVGREDEALSAYERALKLDASFADAHWNAARLYEQLHRDKDALRHFSAYRRLRR